MSAAAQRRLDALDAHLAAPRSEEVPPGDLPEQVEPSLASGPGRHRAVPLPGPRRVTAALEDRLPAGARTVAGRGTSGHHVAVIAVVLACCLAVTAWWVVSGRAQPQPVSRLAPAAPLPSESVPDSPGAGGTGTSPDAADPRATGDATVIVDVAGKVRHPGIVTLPLGSRVVDALKAVGGARASVDLTSLNLARELVDGEQLLVGLAPPPHVPPPTGSVPGATATAPVGLVNLNTATIVELDTLPGVGPVTAQAILDWRVEHGSFSSVDELLEVDGIGEATLADLRDLVTV